MSDEPCKFFSYTAVHTDPVNEHLTVVQNLAKAKYNSIHCNTVYSRVLFSIEVKCYQT